MADIDLTPTDPTSAGARLRAIWLDAEDEPRAVAPVSMVLSDAKVWEMRADGVTLVGGDWDEPSDPPEIADLGRVCVTCVSHRWSRKGAIRVFQVFGGGRFDRFQLIGKLPPTKEKLRPQPKAKCASSR